MHRMMVAKIQAPRGTSSKKKGCGKKKTLVFEVEQVRDNENIFEGRVQENIEDTDPNNDKDGSFSLEDTDCEYESFAIPGDLDRDIDTDNGLGLSTKNLANDMTRKDPLLSDKPWRKGESRSTEDTHVDTETLACPNTVDPDPCTNTEMPTQPRSAIPPVKNDEPVPTPSTSGQAKPIVVSSNNDRNNSEYTLVRRQVRKLLNDKTRVRSEVLTDLGAMIPTEVTIAKAFAYGQATKAFEWLGMRDISSDTEEFIVEYNANLTTILIGRSFMAPDDKADRSKLWANSFAEQKADIIIAKRGLPHQVGNTPIDLKTETGTKHKQPRVKIETTGKKIPSWEEDEMRVIKEKVTFQRIRNSQLRNGMKPTIPNQGIIFNENNNPWLEPDFAESNTQTRQSSIGHKVHTCGGGPLDDGDSPDNEDDNNQGNGKHKAKLWFQERISRLAKPKPTFVEVIVEMYRRFINKSAQQDACDAFKEAKWPDSDGRVQGWHNKIMCLIEDMDIPPDQYSIKEKFMEGLPNSIQLKVFADKMSIEYNSVDELVELALDAEYTVRTQKRFSKIARASCPGDRTEDADKGKNQTGDYQLRFSGYQKNKGFFKNSIQ
ncbi:hypothetical protein ARMGADRAFT_1029003 [Armillaria gallica]|uniref:Uncharacterized protein n=1 Tax=Armillaria gallica TaxID=47427 RepID=A0A2H3DKJ2_ARMGA|nr:hypothetical protein ARMGADRAFT_1029003 [Armillaria gallica]